VIELSGCGYIADHTNVILIGPPGVGKTHVATGLTLAACRAGYNAKFFTAAGIVNTSALKLSFLARQYILDQLKGRNVWFIFIASPRSRWFLGASLGFWELG